MHYSNCLVLIDAYDELHLLHGMLAKMNLLTVLEIKLVFKVAIKPYGTRLMAREKNLLSTFV